MRRDDALDHAQALIRLETRDGGDAPLRLVQEIRGRAESATHRAIIESDQAHRADLGEVGLARRLAGESPDAVRVLEPLPVRLVWHPFVRGAEDRVAQLGVVEGTLRQLQGRAIRHPLGGAGDAAEGLTRTQSRGELEQRLLAFPQHHTIERSELEHELGPERRLHAARDQQSPGGDAACEMRQLEIKLQRHAGRVDANDVPGDPQELAFQRPLRRPGAAIGIEDLGPKPCGFEHACQPPHAQGGRKKGVLPAMRVVGTDQQNSRSTCAGVVHFWDHGFSVEPLKCETIAGPPKAIRCELSRLCSGQQLTCPETQTGTYAFVRTKTVTRMSRGQTQLGRTQLSTVDAQGMSRVAACRQARRRVLQCRRHPSSNIPGRIRCWRRPRSRRAWARGAATRSKSLPAGHTLCHTRLAFATPRADPQVAHSDPAPTRVHPLGISDSQGPFPCRSLSGICRLP